MAKGRRISPEDRLARNEMVIKRAAEGASYDELAREAGLTFSSMKNLCSRLNARVTPARRQRAALRKRIIVERVKAGVPYKKIAAELGMHVGSIRRLVSEAGVVRWRRRKEAPP